VSPYPESGGGRRSAGVGGAAGGGIALLALAAVFRLFFGLLGALGICVSAGGGLKSGGQERYMSDCLAIPFIFSKIMLIVWILTMFLYVFCRFPSTFKFESRDKLIFFSLLYLK
jgi:hypothetical protein